jgi:hypothetical protein
MEDVVVHILPLLTVLATLFLVSVGEKKLIDTREGERKRETEGVQRGSIIVVACSQIDVRFLAYANTFLLAIQLAL